MYNFPRVSYGSYEPDQASVNSQEPDIHAAFEMPKPANALATMLVSLELVADNSTGGRIARLHFEAEQPLDGLVTVHKKFSILNEGYQFGHGNFTFQNARTGKTCDDRRFWPNIGDLHVRDPIQVSDLVRLPYTVDHPIPEEFLAHAKNSLNLMEGDEALIRLNLQSVKMTFWTFKAPSDIQESFIISPFSRATTKEHYRSLGHELEMGENPHLLHWDISKAYCPIDLS